MQRYWYHPCPCDNGPCTTRNLRMLLSTLVICQAQEGKMELGRLRSASCGLKRLAPSLAALPAPPGGPRTRRCWALRH